MRFLWNFIWGMGSVLVLWPTPKQRKTSDDFLKIATDRANKILNREYKK